MQTEVSNMKKLAAVGCVLMLAVSLTGCDPRGGADLEGTWIINLTEFLEFGGQVANLPFVPNPEAKIVFDDGELDVRIDTDLPVIGWFIKGQITGTYQKEKRGVIDTVILNLETLKVRICCIGIPISDMNITTLAAYKIIEDNIYVIPGYDLVPQEMRDQFENGTLDVPWLGDGDIRPLVWTRK